MERDLEQVRKAIIAHTRSQIIRQGIRAEVRLANTVLQMRISASQLPPGMENDPLLAPDDFINILVSSQDRSRERYTESSLDIIGITDASKRGEIKIESLQTIRNWWQTQIEEHESQYIVDFGTQRVAEINHKLEELQNPPKSPRR